MTWSVIYCIIRLENLSNEQFQVEEFLDTQPILWLPSDVWFEFLDRRLGILADAHGRLYQIRPPNYGVLSGLFANLMQSVIFTPPVVNIFVRESLAALEYKRNCASDGMFFLHTFDLEKQPVIEGVLDKDDSSIKRFLGGGLPKPGVKLVRETAVEDVDEGEEFYPLGRTPTWSQIKLSLKRGPFELMPKWIFPVELKPYAEGERGSIERKACQIFIKFCRAVWIILHPAWMAPETHPIKPRTIEGALESLSVDSICERMENIEFRACNSGFREVSGRPMLSFEARWKIYFPAEGVALKKRWEVFAEESGYLHLYHKEAKRLGTDDTRELNRCLAVLLSHSQCLPDSDLPEGRDNIWRVDQQQLILLANPKYYRISGVGTTSVVRNRRQRAPAAHRPLKDVQQQFLMQQGFSAAHSAKAVKIKATRIRNIDRRSKKAKNARQPPKRKYVSNDGGSSSEDEGYEPEDRSNDDDYHNSEEDVRPKKPKKRETQGYEPEDRSNDDDYDYNSLEDIQPTIKARKPQMRRTRNQIPESDNIKSSSEGRDEEVEGGDEKIGRMKDDDDDNPYDM